MQYPTLLSPGADLWKPVCRALVISLAVMGSHVHVGSGGGSLSYVG